MFTSSSQNFWMYLAWSKTIGGEYLRIAEWCIPSDRILYTKNGCRTTFDVSPSTNAFCLGGVRWIPIVFIQTKPARRLRLDVSTNHGFTNANPKLTMIIPAPLTSYERLVVVVLPGTRAVPEAPGRLSETGERR